MLANTTKLPSEKVNASDRRCHTLARMLHTSGIGIARIIKSVRMLIPAFT